MRESSSVQLQGPRARERRAAILLVDDEPGIVATLRVFLEDEGHEVLTAGSAEAAMAIVDAEHGASIDVIVTDIRLPSGSGVELLAHARRRRPEVEVVLISGAPNVETASAAVRLGACDYLLKPIRGHELADIVEAALDRRIRRKRELATARDQAAHIESLERAVEARSRELMESSERYRQLVDRLEILVFEIDLPTRRLTHLGGALSRRFGGGATPASDCDFLARAHPEDRDTLRRILDELAAGARDVPEPFEVRFTTNDESTFWARCVLTPRTPSDRARLSGIVVDLTAQKRAEEERAALEAELERARQAQDRRLLQGLGVDAERASVRIRPSEGSTERETMVFGRSRAMADVRHLAEVGAEHDEPILVIGETGTGKGALAEWIHRRSPLARGPFVALNCATLRGDLLASELFGHARGAFTSAVSSRRGLIEEAAGGTLFLDEIGETCLEVQTLLLKVLEEKTFRRVGESKVVRSEFRLLSATNRDLHEEVEHGRFRRDLLYRIDVLPIALPPLRERPEDVEPLARALLDASGGTSVELADDTLGYLAAQPWPGNVRELRNALIRATLLSRGKVLRPEHFEGFVSKGRPATSGRAASLGPAPAGSSDERARILELLARFDGNRAKVARSLGVARSSLYRKLRAYGIA